MKLRIMNVLTKLYIRFKGRPALLHKAVRQAQKRHKKDGKRYRVFFFGYKYRVWNRQEIQVQKRIGLLKSNLKVGEDFDKICFYDTQNSDRYVFDK